MVAQKDIVASNALISDATAPQIAVFFGGTSGIGNLTIKALVATGVSTKIYLVGRKSSAERMQTFIEKMHSINPKAEIIWTEAEISLLSETKRVCEEIKSKETRVDLLFLTAGYAPFGTRKETSEGVEVAQSLEYYSRVLAIQHLLPLLNKSESSRVISVLGGSLERANINLEDLDLKKPGNFSGAKAQTQYVIMNTIALDKLASGNPNITFMHSWPGWVNTGNVRRGGDPNSWWSWFVWLVLDPLIQTVAISDDASGQRHLFQCTSAAFGGRGAPWDGKAAVNSRDKQENGLFLVGYKCDTFANAKVMTVLRENAQAKVWDHTQEVLRPYL